MSSEHVLIIGQDYPGAYGGYMHPFLAQNGGQDIYFTVSEWGPYAVSLFHAHLERPLRPSGADPPTGTTSTGLTTVRSA